MHQNHWEQCSIATGSSFCTLFTRYTSSILAVSRVLPLVLRVVLIVHRVTCSTYVVRNHGVLSRSRLSLNYMFSLWNILDDLPKYKSVILMCTYHVGDDFLWLNVCKFIHILAIQVDRCLWTKIFSWQKLYRAVAQHSLRKEREKNLIFSLKTFSVGVKN